MSNQSSYIELSEQERMAVNQIIADNTESPSTVLRATILKLSDSINSPILSVVKIAELTGSTRQTVTKIRNIYREEGFDTALKVLERNRHRDCKENSTKLLGKIRDIISEPPKSGRPKWSIRSLCSECIERGYVDYISPPTMMIILQKNNIIL